ncbi:hypothetical protein DC522_11395 [Microvirga sp. KLBC 81]|nr:hypothetical protein DC522_11395 [Microvirga sp. KLBC 81]
MIRAPEMSSVLGLAATTHVAHDHIAIRAINPFLHDPAAGRSELPGRYTTVADGAINDTAIRAYGTDAAGYAGHILDEGRRFDLLRAETGLRFRGKAEKTGAEDNRDGRDDVRSHNPIFRCKGQTTTSMSKSWFLK